MKDPYTENYKILLREIKKRDIPDLWVRKLNIVNISILPKLVYRFKPTPVKITAAFFVVEMNKLILQFIWKCKGRRIAKATLKKKQLY